MQLSEKQLKVQQRADKTLIFGCIVEIPLYNYCYILMNNEERMQLESISVINKCLCNPDRIFKDNDLNSILNKYGEIIGHPMTRGRLNWFLKKDYNTEAEHIYCYIDAKPDIMIQDIFTWSEEFIDLVIAFLETLPKNTDDSSRS